MFLPEFKPSKMMLAGSGSATYIKSIKIAQIARSSYKDIISNPNASDMLAYESTNCMGRRQHTDCCSII
jgi:hypothetical protein